MRLITKGTEAIVMVLDVVRGYLAVAGGLTDITVQRARTAAEAILTHGSAAAEASSEQVSQLAEDLLKQSQTNREILIGMIRTEVDRAVGRMGFVREEELAAVRNHVNRLEAQLKVVQTGAGTAGAAVARTAGGTAARTLSTASGAVAAVPVPKPHAKTAEVSATKPPAPAKKTTRPAQRKSTTGAAPTKAARPAKRAATVTDADA
jgi:polyhydroxyalkanoate synthesis regulator phasin